MYSSGTSFAEDRRHSKRFALDAVGLYFDYSKNYIITETMRLLLALVAGCGLRKHVDVTKHSGSTNALIQRWHTLKRGTA